MYSLFNLCEIQRPLNFLRMYKNNTRIKKKGETAITNVKSIQPNGINAIIHNKIPIIKINLGNLALI